MRLASFGLGLLCALPLACGDSGQPGETTGGGSTTGSSTGGSSTGGSTEHATTGSTHDTHTTGSGSDSATTGADTTTGTGTTHDTTGTTHDHTTDHSSTGHDTTGTTHDTTGTTHDTTGNNTDTCADLGEAECMAQVTCMPIHGAQIDQQLMCMGPKTFVECTEAALCGQALTIACDGVTKEAWLFPNTCIPDGFVPCDVKPFDQMCN